MGHVWITYFVKVAKNEIKSYQVVKSSFDGLPLERRDGWSFYFMFFKHVQSYYIGKDFGFFSEVINWDRFPLKILGTGDDSREIYRDEWTP